MMALRDLVKQYGISFKKSLGQNLLLDDNINRIMVDSAGLTAEDDVIEVGAGLGALTTRLCQQAGRLLSIEIDRAFMPCLEDQFAEKENVALFRGDVLNHSVQKLVDEFLPGCTKLKIVANLPYYITTPILFHFWEGELPVSRVVVMVQEEVALRMVASVGAHDYGMLSIASQYHGQVDIVHRVPRTCFRPQPKVDSCIVRLRGRGEPLYPDVDRGFLFRMIRAAFGQRRKTLRNSLTRSAFGAPADAVLAAFEETGIDPGRRPQTLTLDDFAALAQAIRKRC
ncbi:MAG: 16S rRNA (adenine(1518)-N(6)/adenine(1519)-N(6))-dimethyltransferase RsmA [bacterium]|nr:16S rRNA (adenine(1518)-N(6)/adenine(1519)-N(6))-dimethyltransferase RsmA [bacterium]